MTTLGVIADTHIPDRAPALPTMALEIFRQARVSAILHAGDVMLPRVLAELEQIAPVQAVRGNRDIFTLPGLPLEVRLVVEGVRIGMAHGHGTLPVYLRDKLDVRLNGKRVERYIRRMLAAFPQEDVIVFGHLHVAGILHLEGKVLFNPGSPCCPWPRKHAPSVGLLHLQDGEVQGEIIEIESTPAGFG